MQPSHVITASKQILFFLLFILLFILFFVTSIQTGQFKARSSVGKKQNENSQDASEDYTEGKEI